MDTQMDTCSLATLRSAPASVRSGPDGEGFGLLRVLV